MAATPQPVGGEMPSPILLDIFLLFLLLNVVAAVRTEYEVIRMVEALAPKKKMCMRAWRRME